MKTPEEYDTESLRDQQKVAVLFNSEDEKYKDKILGELSYQLGKWKMYARLESIAYRNLKKRLEGETTHDYKPVKSA